MYINNYLTQIKNLLELMPRYIYIYIFFFFNFKITPSLHELQTQSNMSGIYS